VYLCLVHKAPEQILYHASMREQQLVTGVLFHGYDYNIQGYVVTIVSVPAQSTKMTINNNPARAGGALAHGNL
jgi:hypothetical protein